MSDTAQIEALRKTMVTAWDSFSQDCSTPEASLRFLKAELAAAGFKIMPREPTEAMLWAGLDSAQPKEIFRAMWDAAP